MNKIYYRDAHIVIILYDCTKKNTIREVVEGWYTTIAENLSARTGRRSSKAEVIVVGTKSDLVNVKDLEDLKVPEYSKVACSDLQSKGMRHFYISSVTLDGYDELEGFIVERCGFLESVLASGGKMDDVVISKKSTLKKKPLTSKHKSCCKAD